MKEKLKRWIGKKIKAKPEDVMVKRITVEYDYISPVTMEITPGKKTIELV